MCPSKKHISHGLKQTQAAEVKQEASGLCLHERQWGIRTAEKRRQAKALSCALVYSAVLAGGRARSRQLARGHAQCRSNSQAACRYAVGGTFLRQGPYRTARRNAAGVAAIPGAKGAATSTFSLKLTSALWLMARPTAARRNNFHPYYRFAENLATCNFLENNLT